jgi:hypothetical protein
MASYDELYAEIVGDRDVLYDATAEAHHRIAGLLTSDSPPEEGAGWSPVDEPARREELSRHVGERQPGRYVVHLDDEPLAC